jgi:hypothetical protein
MKIARDPTSSDGEGRAILDQLPELYFAILKNTHIEQQAGQGIRCSFELPVLGKRTKTAPTVRDAIRAVLFELSEVLTRVPYHEWPQDWRALASSMAVELRSRPSTEGGDAERFRSKARQFTIGVTMPGNLKRSLQQIASEQHTSFAEVARKLAGVGFEDFDERSFSEGSEELLAAFSADIDKWQPSETEQVMVRLDHHLAVRLRSAAKEHGRSASEFGAICLAHGFDLRRLCADIEQKVAAVRGSRLRGLAPKVGLAKHVALLSGVLAGSIAAPRKVLKCLGEAFETPEYALTSFFNRSFESRAVPAFKAENGKPQVFGSPRLWEEAVKSLNLPPDQTKELLLLDE